MLEKDLIISPPFGNFIGNKHCLSVKGTYTVLSRSGMIKQWIKTVRLTKEGIVNNIGFRNPGLKALENKKLDNRIVSIAGFTEYDWNEFLDYIPNNTIIEINLGCPNVGDYNIRGLTLRRFVEKFNNVILKLPANHYALDIVCMAGDNGVKMFHCCNTIKVDRGGLSGRKIQEISLPLIQDIKQTIKGSFVIGGGGIYTMDDLKKYKTAGADAFSLSTIWFNPLKAIKLINQYEKGI